MSAISKELNINGEASNTIFANESCIEAALWLRATRMNTSV
jgi:hypothetical protein